MYSRENRKAEKSSVSSEAPRQVTIPELLDEIERAVLEHYCVPRERVFSRSRFRKYVMPRQVMHYIARHLTPMTMRLIGERFPAGAGYHHSTVIHSIRVVSNYMETDDLFNDTIEAIYADIVRDGITSQRRTQKLTITKTWEPIESKPKPIAPKPKKITPKAKRHETMSEQEKVIAKYAPKENEIQPVGKMDVQITKL